MKKIFGRLLILSISAIGLAGCSLFDFSEGDVDSNKKEDKIELRDYTQTVIKDESYTFDGEVYLIYDDETEKEVTKDCTFDYSTLDTSKIGNESYFTVHYEGDQYKFSKKAYLNVDYLKLLSIDAVDYTDTVKAKETYVFDGKVMAKYNAIKEKDVTKDANIGTIDTSKAGSKELIISYSEDNVVKTVKKSIEVTKELVSITISGYTPSFEVGQGEYNFNGTITATYSDDSTENITAKAEKTNNVDLSTIGTYVFSATYEYEGIKLTETVEILVTEHIPVLQSIAASNYSTEVNKGSTYSFDGVVMATFDVGSPVDVTSACSFSTISTNSVGNKTLTISYTDPNKSSNKKTTTITVEVVARVTGISANESYKVGVGKSKSLNASVIPAEAKNKGLTYSSSNNSVVTVNSSGTITGVAVGTASITITSVENSSITKVVPITVETIVQDKWTIMIYICGADLESQGGYATKDIKEILGVSGQPDDVNIVIETGGSNSWSLSSSYIVGANSISSNYLGRWYVRGNKLNFVENIDLASMGLTSTYQSFLSWATETYPADNYGVILWNHGGGLDGVCYDELFSDDSLLNSEMKAAHSSVIGSDKFEFVGYDACLMQNMEIADYNAPYFNYQIASQESEAGNGWYYTGWIDDLYADKSTTTLLEAACDTFITSVGSSSDQTLSFLNLNQLSTFKTAFEAYASALNSKLDSKNVDKDTFATYVRNNVKAYSEPGYGGYGQFDVIDFVSKLQSQTNYKVDTSYATAVTNAVSNLVAHNATGTGAGESNGLSLTYKCSKYSSYNASEIGYSNWKTFNNSYGTSSASGGGWY